MNRTILGVLLTTLIVSAVAVWYFAVPLDTHHLEADITVSESRNAFKLMNDSVLHFGNVTRDNSAVRYTTITNIRDRPITATVYIDGPRWLSVNENRVRLGAGEERNLTFTADPQEDTPIGDYSWDVMIVYRRI